MTLPAPKRGMRYAPHTPSHIIILNTLIAILLAAPTIGFAATVTLLDSGVSWQSITISPEELARAKKEGNTLLMRSDSALLFQAERTIQLGTLLEPALLISHEEFASDFSDHHPPNKTVLRLKPQHAVEHVFQSLQDVLCKRAPDALGLSLNAAVADWLPIAIAAVPTGVTTSASMRFAQDLAVVTVVLFFKAGPDACNLPSPYEGAF